MLIYKRHIAKSISWRFIATIDTIVIAFIISSDLSSGLKIGLFEIITKIFLYFLHERLWFKYGINNANYRHIFKTISWRLLGTTDTINFINYCNRKFFCCPSNRIFRKHNKN